MTLAAERLGAKIGLIAVLHTWGQTLTHHPHVHCLVPGGGVALDGQRWVACKPNFLLSVHALSKTFRRLFLDGLEAAFARGELGFFGDLAPLAEPDAFAERVRALRQSPFVVYAKPPFGGPERVLAYLARYTHRTAIANSRLVDVTTTKWRSPTRTIVAAGASASCASPRTSSSAAFSSTSCPTASTASVTTASSPRATEAKTSRACAACSGPSRRRARRRQQADEPADRHAPRQRSPAAPIAAASCAASASSRPTRRRLPLRHIMTVDARPTRSSLLHRLSPRAAGVWVLAVDALRFAQSTICALPTTKLAKSPGPAIRRHRTRQRPARLLRMRQSLGQLGSPLSALPP